MTAFPGPSFVPSVQHPWFQQPAVARGASVAGTNAGVLKTSAGMIYGFFFANASASQRFVKLYNKAASPVVGTDTPLFTIILGGSSSFPVFANFQTGIAFQNGIAFAITGGVADSDTTAINADDVHGTISFS